MKLIIGLGNPGGKYEKTRHNIGSMVIEQFLKDFTPVQKTLWEDSTKFKSDIAELEWKPLHGALEKVILAKPKTYMNNSGLAVQLLTSCYSLLTSDLWIVHDDLDLSLGQLKIRFGGGSAGNHGVDSIIEKLETDKFWRFRLGIGNPRRESGSMSHESRKKPVDDHVLSSFMSNERSKVKHLIRHASDALQMALEEGLETAMNRFNTK